MSTDTLGRRQGVGMSLRRYLATGGEDSATGPVSARQLGTPHHLRGRIKDDESFLSGDREEYTDRSFWKEGVSADVTFTESRVDGLWEEDGGESWK